MSNFQKYAAPLLSNGYLIIPIKHGHKAPALDNWQHARLGATDIPKYGGAGLGVGVLCGQGAFPVCALDVDSQNQELIDRFTDWCREHLGDACERVGAAPKILLAYRAESAGWGKSASAWFEGGGRHRLEVLGKGQQFVAHHVHPGTGRPYEWTDLLGGLAAVAARDLPVVSAEQVAEAVRVFERMAVECGLSRVQGSVSRAVGVTVEQQANDPLMTWEPTVGLDMVEAETLLAHVDNEDYDTWLRVGMSLHHEFAGSDEALDLWDTWSSGASNYGGRDDVERRWSSFGKAGRAQTTARWLLKVGRAGAKDAALVGKRAALDQAKARVLACTDSIVLINDVAKMCGQVAGTDIALRAELAGLLKARFGELTDTTLAIADIRAAMGGGQRGVVAGRGRRGMTEFGNAERMLDHYGEGLRYVPEIDVWLSWTGVYWRNAAYVELEHLAKETIGALTDEVRHIESDTERDDFFKFCAASQRALMVRNMVQLAKSDPRVVVSVVDLDSRPELLGCGNGAVDLRSGKLVPPDPGAYITQITPVEYVEGAEAPLFEQTVLEVFCGDVALASFFQRLVGYSLLAQPTEDVLVIPYGSGSNGKSTVLGAVRDALGAHAKMASAETFLSNGVGGANAGSAREDVLRLRGARFVYVSEPDEGSELREGMVKSMTGGESMPARGLYSRVTVEVRPTWVAFMPTNHRPIVKGDDHAIWRRLLPVPFLRNFDADLIVQKDTGRAARLAEEAPGILAWCVRGALGYQAGGLRPPEAVQAAREGYRGDMDLLGEWLDECCDVGDGCQDTTARLWASWEMFARGRGELRYIPSSKGLGRRLAGRFEQVRDVAGMRGRGFRGVEVKALGIAD